MDDVNHSFILLPLPPSHSQRRLTTPISPTEKLKLRAPQAAQPAGDRAQSQGSPGSVRRCDPSPLTPDSKAQPRLPPPPTSPPGVFFFPPPGCFGFGRSARGAVAGGSCRQGQPRAGGEPEAAPGPGREDSGRNLRPRPSTGASKSDSPRPNPPPLPRRVFLGPGQPGPSRVAAPTCGHRGRQGADGSGRGFPRQCQGSVCPVRY